MKFKHVKASSPGQDSMRFVCCRRKECESFDANLSHSIAAFLPLDGSPGQIT